MSFLNPALLAGAALFAVPLVIHLLNRQRHKRRPWAAMEFLLRAYQKQRNRLRNENLLLLLLRCLVPIVLALAIARPVLDSIAGPVSSGGLVHHVVVLDASYSMGAEVGAGQSAFDRGRALIGKLLDRLEQDQQTSSKFTLVTAGVRPRFLVSGDLDLGFARGQWFGLQRPDDAAGDLTQALDQTADFLEKSADPEVRVYVLTDLQRRSFGHALTDPKTDPKAAAAPPAPTEAQKPSAELTDSLRDIVEHLQARRGTYVHWIDCGPFAESLDGGDSDNFGITGLELEAPVAIAKSPCAITARLHNRGQAAVAAEVTLEIDGGEPMRRLVDVPAGAEGEAEFTVSFREPGRHRVRAYVPNDALAADDERFLVVDVRDRVRVLVVDGDADPDPLRTYGYFFGLVLDPDAEALPTFAVKRVDTLALLGGQVKPADYDVTILADVDRLNAEAARAVQDALRAGRGLLVAYGQNVDAESYNLQLYAAGTGPQPFRLLEPLGGRVGDSIPRHPRIVAAEDRVFAEFEEDVYREIFQAIPVWRWYGLVPDSLAAGTTVAATLTDAEQSPLLVTGAFAEGRTAFLTSPIASPYRPDRWNRLDDMMVAYPLLFGLVKWLALPATDPFQAAVGQMLTCTLPARPTAIELQRAERDGGGKEPIGDEPVPLPGDRFALPGFSDARHAGFYTFDLVLDRDDGRVPMQLPFAVNVDPAEGELRYAAHAEAKEALGVDRVLNALPTATAAAADQDRNDFGPSLLLATLLFVLGEATLARYVSRRRA